MKFRVYDKDGNPIDTDRGWKFKKPFRIDRWRDGRDWVVQVLDAEGYQIGDAIYVGSKDQALRITAVDFNLPDGIRPSEIRNESMTNTQKLVEESLRVLGDRR